MITLTDRPCCLTCGELARALHQVGARAYEVACACGRDLVQFPFPVSFTYLEEISQVRMRGHRWSIVEKAERRATR